MDIGKAYLVGNVGNSPEVRSTQDGTRVASFSLAVNRKSKGEEITDWYRVSAWRGLADIVEKYVHKGSRLMVDGSLSIRKYKTNDGTPGTSVELDARDLVMLDPPSERPDTTTPYQPPAADQSGMAPSDDLPFK